MPETVPSQPNINEYATEIEITPFHNVVVARKGKTENKTASGIELPSQYQHEVPHGWAVAVGPECESVAVGMYVIWDQMHAREVTHDGAKFVLIPEDHILGCAAFVDKK